MKEIFNYILFKFKSQLWKNIGFVALVLFFTLFFGLALNLTERTTGTELGLNEYFFIFMAIWSRSFDPYSMSYLHTALYASSEEKRFAFSYIESIYYLVLALILCYISFLFKDPFEIVDLYVATFSFLIGLIIILYNRIDQITTHNLREKDIRIRQVRWMKLSVWLFIPSILVFGLFIAVAGLPKEIIITYFIISSISLIIYLHIKLFKVFNASSNIFIDNNKVDFRKSFIRMKTILNSKKG